MTNKDTKFKPAPKTHPLYLTEADSERPAADGYLFRKKIGEGGMGEVWLAEQNTSEFSRQVAVKIIKSAFPLVPEILNRFQSECRSLSQMSHPNVASVFESGYLDDGTPFLTMEYVDGVPLDVFVETEKLGFLETLKLFRKICFGVQHAHQKGVIHRDIKPSNILVILVDGKPTPKLIDFGLATQEFAEPGNGNELGTSVSGTYKYMSPEQASPDWGDVDARSDVFSLGAILYELITGQFPLEAEIMGLKDELKILEVIANHVTPRPSEFVSNNQVASRFEIRLKKLKRMLRNELDAVLVKALARCPDERYESVDAFGNDVQNMIHGEPVLAIPYSLNYRLGKFVQKHRGLMLSFAAVGISLVLGLLGTSWYAIAASENLREVSAQRKMVLRQKDLALQSEQTAINALEKFCDTILENSDFRLSPSFGELRKKLLRGPLTFFDGIKNRLRSQKDIEGQIRLAEIAMKSAELSCVLGEIEPAIASSSEAVEILEVVVESKPQESEALARAYHLRGSTFFRTGKFEEAKNCLDKSIDLLKSIELKPGDGGTLTRVARLQVELANHLDRQNRSGQAIDLLKRLIGNLRDSSKFDSDIDLKLVVCDGYIRFSRIALGTIEYKRNASKRAEVTSLLNDGEEILWSEIETPNSIPPALRERIAETQTMLSFCYRLNGDREEALRFATNATHNSRKLVDFDPVRIRFLQLHAICLMDLGWAVPDRSEALTRFREAQQIRESLVKKSPRVLSHRVNLSKTLTAVAKLLLASGQLDSAKSSLRKAIFHAKVASDIYSSNENLITDLGRNYYLLTVIAQKTKDGNLELESLKEWVQLVFGITGEFDREFLSELTFADMEWRVGAYVDSFTSYDELLGRQPSQRAISECLTEKNSLLIRASHSALKASLNSDNSKLISRSYFHKGLYWFNREIKLMEQLASETTSEIRAILLSKAKYLRQNSPLSRLKVVSNLEESDRVKLSKTTKSIDELIVTLSME